MKRIAIMLMMIGRALAQQPTDTMLDGRVDAGYYARLIFEQANSYRAAKGHARLEWDSSVAGDCARHSAKICRGEWVRMGNENCAVELFDKGYVELRTYEQNAKKVLERWKKNQAELLGVELMTHGAVGIDTCGMNIVFRMTTTIVNERIRPPLYRERLKDTDTATKENFDMKFLERQVIESINRHRARHGIKPLRWDYALHQGAKAHSEWMAKTGKFMHLPGYYSGECCSGFGIGFRDGLTYRQMADGITQIWINSPGHNAQLLTDRTGQFGEVDYRAAVGIAQSTDYDLGVPIKKDGYTVTPVSNSALGTFRIISSTTDEKTLMQWIRITNMEESDTQRRLMQARAKSERNKKARR